MRKKLQQVSITEHVFPVDPVSYIMCNIFCEALKYRPNPYADCTPNAMLDNITGAKVRSVP